MSSSDRPTTAMVLAAGMGSRMRHLSETRPKPLVQLAGKALIDHVLDGLAAAGIAQAVINVHYKADMIERHVEQRNNPAITISNERGSLLDTGGGVRNALPLLTRSNRDAFLVHNSDTVWIDDDTSAITQLLDQWDAQRMDVLMLLARRDTSLGYSGRGDFHLASTGEVSRPAPGTECDYVFAGVSIIKTSLFDAVPNGAFSLNTIWDAAIVRHRVFGNVLRGQWMHVGTPEALAEADAAIAAHQKRQGSDATQGARS